MINQELLNYFLENGKGDLTWFELAEKFNYRPELQRDQRADSIRKKLSKLNSARENASIKSIWKSGDNYNVSYKVNEDDINWGELRDDVSDYITRQRRPYAKPYKSSLEPIICVVSDLHIGSLVRNSKNNKNYSLQQAIDYLSRVADYVNAAVKYNRPVTVLILGDLIESFTGTMHPSTWKEIEAWGADVVISAFEIIYDFLLKIQNISDVRILAGNHDRMADNKAHDSRGEIAKMISYFIEKQGLTTNFEFLVDSFQCGDLQILGSHGHHPLVKNPERMVINYGTLDRFNVILTGHLHSRHKKSPVYSVKMIADSNDKYVHLVVPSIFTGNFYSEALGYYTNPGFLLIDQFEGRPIITDVYL